MTIIIKIPIEFKVKFDSQKQLELLRAIHTLTNVFNVDIKYHEHYLNESCADICVERTISKMGLG